MPVIVFGDFELNPDAGTLRLAGRDISIQPRVFDLLAYLVTNRDRVVGKEELLARVWPRMVVTDASLQRAISLAREVLRKGDLADSIRTHARRGYRFSIDAHPGPAADTPEGAGRDVLHLAREEFKKCSWSEAVMAFEDADQGNPLELDDLERWAMAAQCSGALLNAVEPLERVAAGYAARNDNESGARALILLARIQLESREIAVARGCLRRAASLLKDQPAGVQHGHLEWMNARLLMYEGDLEGAIAHATSAIEIGRALGDPEVETMGLLFQGSALQASGETRRGLELQDEAAATVLAGNISPLLGGIVYCGLIAGCCNIGDWPRAGQWTDNFSRWCERSGLSTFAGSCILHRAEVYAARGDLTRARTEIMKGDEILRSSAPWAVGDAFRLLGDVYLALGEFERAESAYRSANEHGWDPYPGYAVLLYYRGQPDAAIRGLQRAAEKTNWVSGERRGGYLAYIALIAALAGEVKVATEALAELDAHPELWSIGTSRAQVARARGELAFADAQFATAANYFRESMQILELLESPIDAAAVELRLANTLAVMGDWVNAQLEFERASKVLEGSGARLYLGDCEKLRNDFKSMLARS